MQQKVMEQAQERHTKVDRATVNKNPLAEQVSSSGAMGF